MLCLQNHLLRALRAASPAPASPLHRFHLSAAAAAAAASPAQFVVEDYLVALCGLTSAQAGRASKYLRHLKSPAKPDAVRAFLADAGLTVSHVAAAIAVDSRLLCCSVDKTLTPRVAQLRDMGLCPPQISRLITTIPGIFHSLHRIARLEFYISLLGSYDKVEAALKSNHYLLDNDIENVVKPNLAFLQQCGLSACDFPKLYKCTGKLLTNKLEYLKNMVARAEELGVRRSSSSGMFKTALIAICNFTPDKISAKMASMERVLGYPEAKMAMCKLPSILNLSEVALAHRVEFLRMEFGLEPSYIARRPAILMYSLEKRLIPRHYVIQIMKAKGLVKRDIDLYKCCRYPVILAHSHPFLIHLIPPRPHIFGHAGLPRASTPSDLATTRSRPPISHPNPSSSPPRPKPGQARLRPKLPTTPHLTLQDASHGRPPPRLHHPLPRRRSRHIPLLSRRAPRRLLRLRGRARPPLPPPGPAPPPPRRPRQAQSRRRPPGRGELRVRALRGGLGERHPGGDRVGPGEAGQDLRRGGHLGVLRQPDGAPRGEGGAHRRDRQVVRAAAARRQLPQRGRRQPARRAGPADRARVRDRLQRAHRHRGGHRHLRRAARVAGPRPDRAARAEDHRRRQRPDQDPHRPGAHRRLHRAVRQRQLQPHRHERPQADRRDHLGVRVALRDPRRLIGSYSTPSALMLSNYYHEDMQECWPSSDQHICTCDRGGLSDYMWMCILFCKK